MKNLLERIYINNQKHEIKAIELIKNIVIKVPLSRIAIFFNGGKDCMVLFHLIRTATTILKNIKFTNIKIVYSNQYREHLVLKKFRIETSKSYNLDIIQLNGPMQTCINKFVKENKIKYAFMGQRKVDLDAQELKEIQITNGSWEKFYRVNPLLSWSYSDIWKFTENYKIKYCDLYKEGYTSIGMYPFTLKNPTLWNKREQKYEHAKLLKNESMERYGRPYINENKIRKGKLLRNIAILVNTKIDHNSIEMAKIMKTELKEYDVKLIETKEIYDFKKLTIDRYLDNYDILYVL